MKVVSTLIGIFTGAGFGALIEGAEGQPRVSMVWVFFGLAALGVVIVGSNYMFRKLWPSKLDWEFTTNDSMRPQKVFKDRERVYWQSSKPQEDGMYYRLDLRKGRVISGLFFDHGFTNNVPERWTIEFSDEMGFMLLPNKDSTKPLISGTDSIIAKEIENPIKARYIHITITKPRMKDGEAYHWNIKDIHIQENKLGPFYRRAIK